MCNNVMNARISLIPQDNLSNETLLNYFSYPQGTRSSHPTLAFTGFALEGFLACFAAYFQLKLRRLNLPSSDVLRAVNYYFFEKRFWKALSMKGNGQVHGLQNLE